MSSIMGLVMTGGLKHKLRELASTRSPAALPVGGRYRTIDFILSNMVNSGIVNVGVLMQYSYRSLMDHLGLGRDWDLDRNNNGLFLLTPYITNGNENWYKGSADAVYQNLAFLEKSNEEYVFIGQGNCMYVFDCSVLVDYFNEKNADIVIVCRNMFDLNNGETSELGILNLDDTMKILDFEEKPERPKFNTGSLGIYFMKRKLLIKLIQESNSKGEYDFVKDVIIKNINKLNMYGYMYSGYWRSINTISMYYRANMELLNRNIYDNLFRQDMPIYTKMKDIVPAKYNSEANVRNSIVADGCIVEGEVVDSILFRDVRIKKGTVVKNSIVMQGTEVNEGSELENVICDKNVSINNNVKLISDKNYPMVISKNEHIGF
ncbi:MAG: glucose-1-phosphate adenylyltransferase subunit GlgD [Clostridiales bacterium]